MSLTRRRTGLAFLALTAATALTTPRLARAAAADDDDDPYPNVFISPHGEPFRARKGAPYPVADWFRQADKDADGKLDHAEFLADAEAFFKKLDVNGDGALSAHEIALYEHNVAPEVLGGRVTVGALGGGRLWLAQIERPGPIDPGEGALEEPPPKNRLDESGQGAAPFSLFEEPEPILAADLNLDGIIRKDNFLKVADMHFTALDAGGAGYLTLAGLPRTPTQKILEKGHRRRGRS